MPERPLERASSTGRTKHADSWPRGRPAFIRVGEFGIHTRVAMSSKNVSARPSTALADAPYVRSGAAMVRATRQNRSSGRYRLPLVVLHQVAALEHGERVRVQVETMAAGFRCSHANLTADRVEFRKLTERGGPR